MDISGWAGKILKVDLTTGETDLLKTEDYAEKYIGGVGLNAKLFWELTIENGVDLSSLHSFDPQNPFLISTGPLVATMVPSGARTEICSIAPQSDPENYSYSGMGGRWGAELKFAGYDGLAILGKSEEPAYLSIKDEDIAIKGAEDLWGTNTFMTQRYLNDKGHKSAIAIGPAGENLCRDAIILNRSNNAAGQGGFGAVMGSKGLKAVAVTGNGDVGVENLEKLLEVRAELRKHKPEIWAGHDGGVKHIAGKYVAEGPKGLKKYLVRPEGCYGCPAICQGFYWVPRVGKGAGLCDTWVYAGSPREDCIGEGKQYVPEAHNGETVFLSNILEQKLGVNNLSVRAFSDLLYECNEEDIFSPSDFGMPFPEWMKGGCDPDDLFIRELIERMAAGDNVFSKSPARAVETLVDEFGEDVRKIYQTICAARGYSVHWNDTVGGALVWATDTRDPFNSIHDVGVTLDPPPSTELSERAFGTESASFHSLHRKDPVYEEVEKIAVISQHRQRVKNSLTMCEYLSPILEDTSLEHRFYSAVTGVKIDEVGLNKIGERIFNLERAINLIHNGHSREKDSLYDMQFGKNVHYGPAGPGWHEEAWGLDGRKFEKLKDRYYNLRGWNPETGNPEFGKLRELGLTDVASYLAEKELI